MGLSLRVIIFMALSTLLFFRLAHASLASEPLTMTGNDHKSSPHATDCKGACAARCRLSSRPNLCKRACGTCCFRCNCVPSGTAGHYEECPCYASQKTHGGKPKCP